MLTLNDGRNELWQWDTGRKLEVDADCSQVHFSNKVFGRSIDVDVIDGSAIIPDILLQTDKDLSVWSFVGTAENGYTKISKVFKVNRRNKPADYVFTPPDQTSIEEIKEKLEHLESIQDPDAIKNAVEDYLEHNPVEAPVQSVNGKTGKVKLTAEDVGAISQDDLQEATNEALAQAKASGEFNGKDGQDYVLTHDDKTEIAEMAADLVEVPDSGGNADQSGLSSTAANLLVTILRNGMYNTDQSANITALAAELKVTEPEQPDEPVVPDEPDEPEKTLTNITANYSGGDVVVGTAVTALTGIVVIAHYSDGSTETVTGYTLTGTIAEGSNTVAVSYSGMTTTFTVTGIAESSGDEPSEDEGVIYVLSEPKTFDGTSYYDTGVKLCAENIDLTIEIEYAGAEGNGNAGGVLHCVRESSGYPGVAFGISGGKYQPSGMDIGLSNTDTQTRRIVMVKDAANGTMTAYCSNGVTKTVTNVSKFTTTHEQTMWLGAKQNTNGSVMSGSYWKGTISHLKVYNRMCDADEINEFLGVEVA